MATTTLFRSYVVAISLPRLACYRLLSTSRRGPQMRRGPKMQLLSNLWGLPVFRVVLSTRGTGDACFQNGTVVPTTDHLHPAMACLDWMHHFRARTWVRCRWTGSRLRIGGHRVRFVRRPPTPSVPARQAVRPKAEPFGHGSAAAKSQRRIAKEFSQSDHRP